MSRLHCGETHLVAGVPPLLVSPQAPGSDLQHQHSDDDEDDHDDQDHRDADANNLSSVEGGRAREVANIDGEIRLHPASFVLCQAFILTSVNLWNWINL